MKLNEDSLLNRYNILAWENDSIYHAISRAFGLTESALTILYLIYYNGESTPLKEIVHYSGLTKQTINSSLRILEERGIITLKGVDGKSKSASLTDEGVLLSERTVKRLIEWENRALSTFTEEEKRLFLSLIERYNKSLKESFSSYGAQDI